MLSHLSTLDKAVVVLQAMPSLEGQMDTLGREDEHFDVVPVKSREGWPQPLAHHIIIDCSMMSYVDSVGVNMLRSVSITTLSL